jgi:transcriptional regulator with XRE-family HTH domain
MARKAAPTTIDQVRQTLAANIRRTRAGRFAQEALALEAGLDRTMVSKIERGVTSPSLESLLKIANVLGVPLDELLRPVAEDPPPAAKRGKA